MGLSIHYKGSIRDNSLVDELTDEVLDICKSMSWAYHEWPIKEKANQEKPPARHSAHYTVEDLKGITFSPAECEPVCLTFLPDGKLCSPFKLMYNDPEKDDLMIEVVHTKTQFAGPDAHIAVLNLLYYLKNKYFTELEVNDEGLYWDQWDKEVLLSQFRKYNMLLDKFAEAISGLKAIPGESAESLANRLEELLRNKLGGNKDSDIK